MTWNQQLQKWNDNEFYRPSFLNHRQPSWAENTALSVHDDALSLVDHWNTLQPLTKKPLPVIKTPSIRNFDFNKLSVGNSIYLVRNEDIEKKLIHFQITDKSEHWVTLEIVSSSSASAPKFTLFISKFDLTQAKPERRRLMIMYKDSWESIWVQPASLRRIAYTGIGFYEKPINIVDISA